jgi:hypothetical protein
MGYTIEVSKAGNAEFITIEYPDGNTFEPDFKECLMISVEEMEESRRVDWAVYCEGPDGEGTRLALIQGAAGAGIEAEIREITAREWQAAQDWHAEHANIN